MLGNKIVETLKKPYVIFAILALTFGFIFVKITPPLWGLDEQSHFARVFHILRGEFVSSQDKNNKANFMPDNFFELYQYRTQDILDVVKNDSVLSRKDITNEGVYKMLLSKHFTTSEHFFAFISNYAPVAYIGPIIGVGIAQVLNFNIGDTLTSARLFSLLSYVILGAVAIWLVRKYKIKWLFLVVALIPTAIFQASVVTADTMLIGSVLLFFALLYRVAQENRVQKGLLITLAIFAIIIPLIKLNYIIVVLSLLALPFSRFGTRPKSIVYKSIVVGVGILIVSFWGLLTSVTATPDLSQRADHLAVNPSGQISFVLHHPLHFVLAITRSLIAHGDMYYQGLLFTVSGNNVITPFILTTILSVGLLAAALIARDEILKIKKSIFWWNIFCVIAALTFFASLYAAFTPIGWPIVDGMQGRYLLSLVVVFVMLLAIFIPVNFIKKDSRVLITILTISILSLLISVAYVWLALY